MKISGFVEIESDKLIKACDKNIKFSKKYYHEKLKKLIDQWYDRYNKRWFKSKKVPDKEQFLKDFFDETLEHQKDFLDFMFELTLWESFKDAWGLGNFIFRFEFGDSLKNYENPGSDWVHELKAAAKAKIGGSVLINAEYARRLDWN